MSNPVLDAAFKRALIYAIVAAIAAVGTAMYSDQSTREIIGAAIVAATPVFLARWGGEGLYDANRAATGKVNPGDVPEASTQVVVTKVAN